MRQKYNEEYSKSVEELLKELGFKRERMTRDEMAERINSEGLYTVRRIDFDNKRLSDNVAFVNKARGGRYKVLITDERGNLTTDESFECAEEAYYSLGGLSGVG